MPEVEPEFKAFISYAHEDQQTAEWLDDFLTKYWVPGFKRRKIFRDQSSLLGRGLTKSIKDGLSNSQYLIVCCSKHSRRSTWVDLEVKSFLIDHGRDKVLACRVGDRDQFVIPHSIVTLEKVLGDELTKPDLTGLVDSYEITVKCERA